MKKFLLDTVLIIAISLSCAVLYNYLLTDPLPLFKIYNPLDSDEPLLMGEQPFIDEIDVEMLKILKERDEIVLIDARVEKEFRISHIPGAVSLPIAEFEKYYLNRSKKFPADRMIVTYCSDRYCIDALQLARMLVRHGHENVFVYLEGMEEWTKLNLPVEAGSFHTDQYEK